jgi:hypothetical protein
MHHAHVSDAPIDDAREQWDADVLVARPER